MSNVDLVNSNSTNKPLIPGNFDLRVLELQNYAGATWDLLPNWTGLSIFESVSKMSIHAELSIMDTGGFEELFPLIGSESIDIVLAVPGTDIEKRMRFYVAKTSVGQQVSDRTFVRTLALVTPESVLDRKYKKSIGFTSLSYSDMVSNIYQNLIVNTLEKENEITKEFVSIEESEGQFRYSFPYMGPLQMIHTIAKRAVSINPKSTGSVFKFYESLGGVGPIGYRFESMETIMLRRREDKSDDSTAASPAALFSYVIGPANYIDDFSDSGYKRRPVTDFIRAKDFKILTNFNPYDGVNTGLFGSTWFSHDIGSMEYKKLDYFLQKDGPNQTHIYPTLSTPLTSPYLMRPPVGQLIGENQTVTRYESSSTVFGKNISFPNQDSPGLLWEQNIEKADNRDLWLQSRESQQKQLETFAIEFTVPGDVRIQAGDVVDLTIPSYIEDNNSGIISNQLRSGKFLCIKLAHHIGKDEYETTIVAVKDSFSNPLLGDVNLTESAIEDTSLQLPMDKPLLA